MQYTEELWKMRDSCEEETCEEKYASQKVRLESVFKVLRINKSSNGISMELFQAAESLSIKF